MIVAGSNLVYRGYVCMFPSRAERFCSGRFYYPKSPEQPEQIGDEPMRKEG